jgi:hypothetical protein
MSFEVRRVQRKRILSLLVLGLQGEVSQFKRKEGGIRFNEGKKLAYEKEINRRAMRGTVDSYH